MCDWKKIWVLIFTLALCAHGEESRFVVDSWGVQDGLPTLTIKALLQTRDGYLWISTAAGLTRFDGLQFQTYDRSNTPEMIGDEFSAYGLWEDREGSVWAGTMNAGLVRYRDGKFERWDKSRGLPSDTIYRIDGDEEGGVWIYTSQGSVRWKNGVLDRREPRVGKLEELSRMLGVDHFCFGDWKLEKGSWWRFAFGRWLPVKLEMGVGVKRAEDLIIDNFRQDNRGRLWFRRHRQLGNAGMLAPDGKIMSYEWPAEDEWEVAVHQDQQGALLVAGSTGIKGFRRGRQFDRLSGLNTSGVFFLLEDREGQLWLGTREAGLLRIRRNPMERRGNPEGSAANEGIACWQDRRGRVWMGTRAGLWLSDDKGGRLFRRAGQRDQSLPNMVTAIWEEQDGGMLVGTPEGIARVSGSLLVDEPVFAGKDIGHVHFIRRDRQGNLWSGSNRGLWRVRAGSREVERFGNASVHAMVEARDGRIWFAGREGIFRWEGEKLEKEETRGAEPSPKKNQLFQDRKGRLWAATNRSGLLGRRADGVWVAVRKAEGLEHNTVYWLMEDGEGWLWMATPAGMSRVKSDALADYVAGRRRKVDSTGFGQEELSELHFGVTLGGPVGVWGKEGKMWLATAKGLVGFDPSKVLPNRVAPKVLVEDCVVGRTRTACRGEINLEPGQRDLEINYSGLSLVRGKQVRFRYRLDHYDRQWVEAERRRTAYYPQLPPGEYVFRVKAGHGEELWSEEEAQLRVVVKPAFHETGWFTALVLVCGGGVVRLLWWRRLRKLEADKKTQQEFSRGLIETQEKERQRIARELHDSIGQSLLLIQNRAVMGLTAGEVEPDVREKLEAIAGTAKASIEEVRQIAADLRPSHLERLGLKQAIEAMVETAQKASAVKLHCDVEEVGDVFTAEEQILVFRVVQEAVSNVLKHSYAREAWVKLWQEGRQIELEVSDDGVGISLASGGRTGMGMKGIEERVTMLQGEYHVETAPGAGCRIKIRIRR